MMNNEAIQKAVAAAAAACGAEGYEINISAEVSAGAEALRHEISSITYNRSGGMSVRCVKDGRSGYASSELVTPEEAAVLVERACANASVVDDPDQVPLFEGSASYHEVCDEVPELPSAEDMKARTLEIMEKAYAASDKVIDGTQSFISCMSSERSFINSAGVSLHYSDALVYHGLAAAVKDGEESADEYAMSDVRKKSVDEIVDKAVSGALSQLGGQSVPSGKYNVILDSTCMVSLLATFSSVFSARSAFLKTTLLAGREGEKIASDIFSVIDDPFHPEKYGHCPFDAEGVAVYCKPVIEKGVLKTLLYNRMFGKLLGHESTGNAASAKEIAPKGLYVQAGDLSKEALLEKLGSGLYITELKGTHAGANVQSGDFSLEAAGFLVEGGKKVSPVKNITLADNFYTLIQKVSALSDTVEFRLGSPFGAPEVLFNDISVSGK